MREGFNLRAIDIYALAYLVLTGPIYAFLQDPPILQGVLLHVLAPLVILVLARLEETRIVQLLRDFYPIALFGLLYTECSTLNRILVPEGYLDSHIIDLEGAWFGSQPARDFRNWVPVSAFSELLHFAYFTYYAYVITLTLTLLLGRSREIYHRAIATVGLTFFVGFFVFIAIPVAGPYYEFARIEASETFLMPKVVQWVLNRGSSVGTAFPSSHVSIATACLFMAWRYFRPLGRILIVLVPLMAAGAVYGGFHYLIDVIAGALLGILCSTVGHRYTLALSGAKEPSEGTTS